MPRTVDTLAAAEAARVKPATIRKWAERGTLERQGTDHRGRTLYLLDDVYRAASARRKRLRFADEPETMSH